MQPRARADRAGRRTAVLAVLLVLVSAGCGRPAAALALDAGLAASDAAPATPAASEARPALPPDAARVPLLDATGDARALCTRACATSQQKCRVQQVAPCVEACLGAQGDATACLARAGDDCSALAACGIAQLCGAPPSGQASCRDGARCLIGCGEDAACSCACLRALSPRKSGVLVAFASCALASCADRCRLGGTVCLSCVQASCAGAAAACMAQ